MQIVQPEKIASKVGKEVLPTPPAYAELASLRKNDRFLRLASSRQAVHHPPVPNQQTASSNTVSSMKASRLNRLIHRWGSILIALPTLCVLLTGVMLQLKK